MIHFEIVDNAIPNINLSGFPDNLNRGIAKYRYNENLAKVF